MKTLWTDGSAMPNPGPGGFAVIEVVDGVGKPVALGREEKSTNIRMEGKALMAAINYAGEEGCEIYTDSEFWVKVLTEWADGWKRRNWRKTKGPVANLDIVMELHRIYHKYPVKLNWVKGHVGTKYNEMADEWANRARGGAEI